MKKLVLEKAASNKASILHNAKFSQIRLTNDYEIKLDMDNVPNISIISLDLEADDLEKAVSFCISYNYESFGMKDFNADQYNSFAENNISQYIEKSPMVIDVIRSRIRRFASISKNIVEVYTWGSFNGRQFSFTFNSSLTRAELNYCFYKMTNQEIFNVLLLLGEEGFIKMEVHNNKNETTYIFKPSLKSFSVPKKSNEVFIICEFSEEYVKFNTEFLIPILKENGLLPIVMNENGLFGNIDIAIKNNIKNSRFVIANISHKNEWNPNVFYEIGMAKAYEKDTIIIHEGKNYSENINDMPFDINSHTCINYTEYPEKLKLAIESLK